MQQLAYRIAWEMGLSVHQYKASVDLEQFAEDVAYIKFKDERQRAAMTRKGPRAL